MSQVKAIQDKLLTQASSMYIPEGYVCEEVLPPVFVVEKTGKLAKYGTDHLRIETTIGGGRGAYRRVEAITRSTDTYSVDSHGLEGVVTPDDRRNVMTPYDAEEDEVLGLTSLLWLKKEKGLADTLTSTSIITQNVTLSGEEQYSDYTNSDPIDDFRTARGTILDATGFMPNIAILDILVWNTLRFHPQMLDALGFKDNRPGGLSVEELAVAMGVGKIKLAKARYESAKEGQTSSLAAVWGKHIVFAVAPASATKYQTSLGYRVQLAGQTPRKVYKYPIYNPPESTGIICEDAWDMFLSKVACAYLVKSVIA